MLESNVSLPTVSRFSFVELIRRRSLETLGLAIFVEAIYWFGTRLVLQYFAWDTYTAELLRTALRLGSAAVIFWLYRDLIRSRLAKSRECRKPSVIGSIVLFVAVPLFFQHPSMQPAFALFFALSAVAVGLKEEILFRGVIQNYLMTRLGFPQSVVLTSFVFAAWHFGVVPNTLLEYAQILLASSILGVLYVRTGSISLVIAMHVLYDMFFSLPNFFVASKAIAFALLFYSLTLACFGAKRSEVASHV